MTSDFLSRPSPARRYSSPVSVRPTIRTWPAPSSRSAYAQTMCSFLIVLMPASLVLAVVAGVDVGARQQPTRDRLREFRRVMRLPRLVVPRRQRILPALMAVADRHEFTLTVFAERPALPAARHAHVELGLKRRRRPRVLLLEFVQVPQRLLPARLLADHRSPHALQLRSEERRVGQG